MAEPERHMGEAERLWSKAPCDSRTTAIYDCGPDPAGVPKERVSEGPPTQPPPKLENVHQHNKARTNYHPGEQK